MQTSKWIYMGIGLGAGVLVGAAGAGQWAVGQSSESSDETSGHAAERGGAAAQASGSRGVSVERISDETFVVVKDQGGYYTTMYYTVDSGIPVLKKKAKYYYPK